MAHAKRIPKAKYYYDWMKSGFPKRKGKAKAFIVKKKRKK